MAMIDIAYCAFEWYAVFAELLLQHLRYGLGTEGADKNSACEKKKADESEQDQEESKEAEVNCSV